MARSLQSRWHPFGSKMKTTTRITLVALFAAISALGLQGQTTGGTTSGGTTTGGTTTGGTTTGVTTTGGSTTGGSTTGGTTSPSDNNGKAKGKDAGTTTGGTTTPPGTANANGKDQDKVKGPNENSSQNAKDVHAVVEQFRTLREGYLAERKALIEKLKTATDDEKKKILEQLRTESAARQEEERALGKQVREDLKKLRDARKSTE